MSKMPKQKPGKSSGVVGTPWTLIRSIEDKYGKISWDLAASKENAKAPQFITEQENSLTVDWHKLEGLLYLNPPFAHIGVWAQKCFDESVKGAKIIMLVPASVGSEWYADFCFENCLTVAIRPRLTFEGHTNCYPKDLMLLMFGFEEVGFELWKWNLKSES